MGYVKSVPINKVNEFFSAIIKKMTKEDGTRWDFSGVWDDPTTLEFGKAGIYGWLSRPVRKESADLPVDFERIAYSVSWNIDKDLYQEEINDMNMGARKRKEDHEQKQLEKKERLVARFKAGDIEINELMDAVRDGMIYSKDASEYMQKKINCLLGE